MISILDTDLYKFTTSYAYMHLFPDAECTFTFIDRNHARRNESFLYLYKREIENASKVVFTDEELEWCVTNIPFIPRFYWEWLKSFHFDINKMRIYLDDNQELHVEVTDKCYKASLYEILCLYTVTEIENHYRQIDEKTFAEKLANKIDLANKTKLKFSEFGTRRRFTFDVQESVIAYIKQFSKTCTGTSNVYFAKKYNMKVMGTHPHEWFMFHGAQYGYRQANYLALENWVKVYDGNLGIALTDTFTTDNFFQNFSLKQAKLFDGIRQDSGDETEFIYKALGFYQRKGINPLTKTIIFSNALTFDKALEIQKKCLPFIQCSFGIGTNLTNDVGYPAENIVMKMSKCRMNPHQEWYNCVKLSDDLEKATGNTNDCIAAQYELGILEECKL